MRGTGPNIRDSGLGDLSVLSDALLLELLGIGALGAVALGRLALVSKSFYCFANLEELWKGMVIEELGGGFSWCGTWQRTYLVSTGLLPDVDVVRSAKRRKAELPNCSVVPVEAEKIAAAVAAGAEGAAAGDTSETAGPGPSSAAADSTAHPQQQQQQQQGGSSCRRLLRRVPGCGRQRYLRVRGFYSDLLYQPWFCATMKLPYEWLETDNIDRRSGLTPEQFRREYEIPNRPVILTDAMSCWPARGKWSCKYLAGVFGDRRVIVGNMPMPFSTYLSYCSSNRDEMPLYLFDKHFTAVAPSLELDYHVPPQFGEDLFGLLGEGERPDYRWLILGPRRSGSSFHVDPNATSAWNALLWGAKKWVMYPPGSVPPGVHPSPDGADVATPLSLTEWFVNFYVATREGKVRPIEFIARPGELLFVPRGWWHCALNLEESCALTQNFVSAVGLPATLAFLKSRRPELVSGCALESRCNLYDRFMAVLREKRPDVLAAVEARQEEARAKAREANRRAVWCGVRVVVLAALFRAPDSQPHAIGSSRNGGGGCANGVAGRHCNGHVAEATEGDRGPRAAASDGIGACGNCGGNNDGGGFSFGFSFGGPGGERGTPDSGSGGGFKFGFGL
ncbi:hypothetical protein VOLCADRAFT_103818 [Volvox carteri f. nagariensis]|uniref:JmjC domain-containing protein n=1 Tax=Volvox carteri f. nagariensis TaxID=3068 RepID=D8TPD9_VOLCA|nr:uncharacterized protein VOLCADRAFT_103818 [Volvox carteri f. nagariensis]EFJ50747.1 hypothetical protein VOLCADRAFT_103818 [Volvox carteri f. nagariensis]|eukprot:XP_002948340.1 hypothetical protein VOLCADRAFT_103818 [Volvox carteri f. nagariensis]